MTAKDRKQLKVFVVLMVVFGVTAYFSLRTDLPSSASSSTPTAASPAGAPQGPKKNLPKDNGDARIRLDLMKQAAEGYDVGRNNLFSYRQAAPPPSTTKAGGTTQPGSILSAVNPLPSPVAAVQPPGPPPGPPPPPPPPPIPNFKYDGFVRTPTGLNASLSDPTNNHFYNLKEDDVLLGRYRIARISDSVIEVEDLEIPQRRAFPRVQ